MSYPPYDQRLANEAAAADQCMKLGGVVLNQPKPQVGFSVSVPPPGQIDPDRVARAINFHWRNS